MSANIPPEKFWINDPIVLFQSDNWYKIIPTSDMTMVQKLNALTRLMIYLFILFLIIPGTRSYYYIPIIVILVIVIYYFIWRSNLVKEQFTVQKKDEKKDKKIKCRRPTKNNPFMNTTFSDLMDNPNYPVCDLDDEEIKSKITEEYQKNIVCDDEEDFFKRGHSQRQFYTTPSTTMPNDQTAFAKWLYQAPPTCKENPLNCLRYEDVRFSRYNPTIDKPAKSDEQ